jgi:D-aminoacyl-tRNA deacylase
MMAYAIITSKCCPAGTNIRTNLLRLFPFEQEGTFDSNPVHRLDNVVLYTIDELHITAEHLDKKINAEKFIFATTHRSRDQKPSLCVHSIGNWNTASLGGRVATLVPPMPDEMKEALRFLDNNKPAEFEVTMEATHHGPYLERPAMFIEIGSTEKEWTMSSVGSIIARAIMRTVEKRKHYAARLLLGGTHYNHAALKIMLRSDLAVGHICPKHALEFLNKDLLAQTTTDILLDWKGLGHHKERVIQLLVKNNRTYKKTKEVTFSLL